MQSLLQGTLLHNLNHMFTAKPIKKDYREGVLQITVEFTDGIETVTQAFNVNSEQDYNNKVDNKRNELNNLKTFSDKLVLNEQWEAPTKEVLVADPVQEALNAVYKAKGELEAKLITDSEYDAVVLAYKTLTSGEVKK